MFKKNLETSFTEFEFHEGARRNEKFLKYDQFVQGPWFKEFSGTVFHVMDSHSDERTGYLQWNTDSSTNDCCPPVSVRSSSHLFSFGC
jgi:hypothetical protein